MLHIRMCIPQIGDGTSAFLALLLFMLLQLACSRREQRKQHTSELIYTLKLGGYKSRRFESFSANWGEVETTSAASRIYGGVLAVFRLSLPPVAVLFIIFIARNRNYFDVPFRQIDCGLWMW